MRDLLDNVSTTATRASSIAGSLFNQMKVQHMVVNNCGVGSLLLLENSKLAPQIQKNCFKNCPPLENYTRAEAERLID